MLVRTVARWGAGYRHSRAALEWELQRLADVTRLTIHMSHVPPGTSKWNKIEHWLFAFISRNWHRNLRGRPLLTHAAIVKLIANTRTAAGLKKHSCRVMTDRHA